MSHTPAGQIKNATLVSHEWHEHIELELGPEPVLRDAEALIPNVELACFLIVDHTIKNVS